MRASLRGYRFADFFEKLPFFVELFINGTFILFYSLRRTDQIPPSWNLQFIDSLLGGLVWAVPLVILFILVGYYMTSSGLESFIRKYIFSVIIMIPLIITWGDMEFSYWLSAAHLLSSVFSLYDSDEDYRGKNLIMRRDSFFDRLKLRPTQLVLLLFFALILVGSFLLMLPFSTVDGSRMGLLNALFIATSATCVTGLSTLSLAENFSLFGQIVVLTLIQIGGLGIMTISSSMTILLGKAFGRRDRVVMQDLLNVSSQEDLMGMIVDIIRYTFWIELWGGFILTFAFLSEDFEFGKAVYYGFFHSISAFCNAGFSLFPNSLESFSGNPLIYLPLAALIILGGVGFIVLREVKAVIWSGKKLMDIGLHSKIVLVTSLILTTLGTLIFFFGEFLGSIDTFSFGQKLGNAFFQSVTLRTAGFNTVPLGQLQTHTIYFMTLFMFIGASPGSTGGGIKTTTFAILIQSIRATLRGRSRVEFFDRTVPNMLVVRATALSIISVIVTTSFIFIMMVVEKEQTFLTVFFEVVSASGTVGMSLGITPYLTSLGKVLISVLMFIGRVGPLTLVLAIGEKRGGAGRFEYPEGRLMIG